MFLFRVAFMLGSTACAQAELSERRRGYGYLGNTHIIYNTIDMQGAVPTFDSLVRIWGNPPHLPLHLFCHQWEHLNQGVHTYLGDGFRETTYRYSQIVISHYTCIDSIDFQIGSVPNMWFSHQGQKPVNKGVLLLMHTWCDYQSHIYKLGV